MKSIEMKLQQKQGRAEYDKYEIFGSMAHAVNWARRGGRAEKKQIKK